MNIQPLEIDGELFNNPYKSVYVRKIIISFTPRPKPIPMARSFSEAVSMTAYGMYGYNIRD